jgi:hypothetical protein
MNFGLYRIIFMNVCVVISFVTVILLRDFGPCWIIESDFLNENPSFVMLGYVCNVLMQIFKIFYNKMY